jgi:hypothetical protein
MGVNGKGALEQGSELRRVERYVTQVSVGKEGAHAEAGGAADASGQIPCGGQIVKYLAGTDTNVAAGPQVSQLLLKLSQKRAGLHQATVTDQGRIGVEPALIPTVGEARPPDGPHIHKTHRRGLKAEDGEGTSHGVNR